MQRKKSFEIQLSPVKLPEGNEEDAQTTDEQFDKPSGNIIEDILDRIGLGKFHWITYCIIGIYWLCDGAEIIALSLLNYVIVHVVWFRTLNEVSMLGSALFGGYFVGSLIAGPITSAYGRRRPFLIYMILIFVFGVLSALAPSFYFLVVTRSFYGVLVGILSPLTSSMITEITPRTKRGINFILVSALFTFGEAVAVFVGAVLQVEEPNSESWRFLLIWVSLPALFALILGYKYLEESPRYHFLNNPPEGIRVLGVMYKLNKKADLELTDDEHEQIQNYVQAQKQQHTDSPIKEIFSRKNLRITISLWIAWWVLNYVYYGIVYVLPLVIARLNKENSSENSDQENPDINYLDILVSISAEFPSYIFGLVLIENKTFGRKQSLAMSFGIAGLFCLGAHFFVDSFFMTCVFFAKFFASAAYEFIYPLTSELYHTNCRTTGLGFASAMSRIGGISMPWITMWALDISPTMTFVTFGVMCLVATLAVLMLPFDTAGRELDKIEH